MPADLTKTLVVMPAFNEAASVGGVVRGVLAALPGAGCLVVDDGSSDATAERAREAGALVARLPVNLGVGGAMRTGFRFAREHGFERVVQVDADGQHLPTEVAKLLAALDGPAGADIVIGARFAGVGEYRATGPRRWAMVLLANMLSRVAGTRLTDATSGFRACGPRAVAIFAEEYPAEYLGDTVEALVIAANAGCRITQVPTEMAERAAGEPSQNAFRSTMYLARVCLALAFAVARPRRKEAVR